MDNDGNWCFGQFLPWLERAGRAETNEAEIQRLIWRRQAAPPSPRSGGRGGVAAGWAGWLREYYLTWCVCCFIMCRLAYTDNCGLGQQLLLVTTSGLRQLLLFLPTEAGLPRYFQPAKASSPGDLRDIQ